jgi:hypothetical protein
MPATIERVVTQHELNRAVLARQFLLERARLPLPRALERVGGLQAQYAPSMYIGLWTRIAAFERQALTRALERRSVVQATLMRATIHLVSAPDYWPFAVGIRRGRQDWWLRVHRGVQADDIAAAAERLRQHLAGRPRHRDELLEVVGRSELGGVSLWLDLVRVPPSGTWEQRRADLYALAEDWLGPADIPSDEALRHLVRRYLGAFGPASPADVAQWAGLRLAEIRPALERLRLRRFRTEEGEELLDLPGAPLPDAKTPAPPRFLPTWDATLLVHARRTAILPERYRPLVFNAKTPQSAPTFLVDGAVAGTWRYADGRVRIEPFEALPRRVRAEVEDEAARLAAFHR